MGFLSNISISIVISCLITIIFVLKDFKNDHPLVQIAGFGLAVFVGCISGFVAGILTIFCVNKRNSDFAGFISGILGGVAGALLIYSRQ